MDFTKRLPPNWRNPMGLPVGKRVVDPGRSYVDGVVRQVEGWNLFWDNILPLAGRLQAILDGAEGARYLTVNLGPYRVATVNWPCDLRGLLREGAEKWITGHGLPPQAIHKPGYLALALWAEMNRFDKPLVLLRVDRDGRISILGRGPSFS